MANVKVTVNVDSSQLNKLKTEINSLQDTKIRVSVDTSGFKALTPEINNSLHALARYNSSVAEVTRANNELVTSNNRVKVSENQKEAAQIRSTKAQKDASNSAKGTAPAQKKLAETTKEVGEAADKAGQSWANFSTLLKYRAVHVAISLITKSLREAFQTIKDVDTQLVVVRKVSGASKEDLIALEKQAYSTASAYGVAADQFLESVAAFTRAGYREAADALAELSVKTQLVGDTTAEVANQFLLSVDKAYKYQGSVEELGKVLDGVNELDNKFATSIDKIASGMGIVAPVAAQMHVEVDELAASIGTITAVTQRSGTEAARALRAIFLNIVGDTKTEIDEGVTWTTGEIAGLREVIKKYAPDAYEAAKATGSIINPMEAIAGLSKSMKDGLLTEQQLMEMISDIGGKLRSSQLLALIENWDMYEDMLDKYATSMGSADKEVENALDSWARKVEVLKNTWTQFMSATVNTDFIKWLVDGANELVKFGNTAGDALGVLGGFVLVFKGTEVMRGFTNGIERMASSVLRLGDDVEKTTARVEAFHNAMSNVAAVGGAAIAGAAAAIAVISFINQLDERQARQSQSAADKSKTTADALWTQFSELKKLEGQVIAATDASDDMIKSFRQQAEVLGYTEDAIDDLIEKYPELTGAIEEVTEDTYEKAYAAAMENLRLQEKALEDNVKKWRNGNKFDPYVASENKGVTRFMGREFTDTTNPYQVMAGSGFSDTAKELYDVANSLGLVAQKTGDAKDIAKYIDAISRAYAQMSLETSKNADLAELYPYDLVRSEYMRLQGVADDYAAAMDKVNELEALHNSTIMDDGDRVAQSIRDRAEAVRTETGALDNFADRLDGATEAIKRYQEATATEKGDAFTSYAGIYGNIEEHYKAGEFGSTEYQEAIKAIASPEMLRAFGYDWEELGKFYLGEFYKGMFESGGEDQGVAFAQQLEEKIRAAGGEWTTESGELIAKFEELDNGMNKLIVDDFGVLADELGLSKDVIISVFDALDMFNGGVVASDSEILQMAEDMHVLSESAEGVQFVNLQHLVEQMQLAGYSESEIYGTVHALQEMDNVKFTGVSDDVETSREAINNYVTDILTAAGDTEAATSDMGNDLTGLNDQEATPKVELDTLVFDVRVSRVKQTIDELNRLTVNIPIKTGIKFGSSAEGTRNHPGGETLVNEEGPEIIQEGGTARIAGGGQPTITYIEPGARVFTAEETKAILQGKSLRDAIIPAAAIGIYPSARRTNSGGSGGSTAAKRTGASNSSAKSSAGTKKSTEKDEQLEKHKAIVALLESELDLLEAQNKPIRDQVAKAYEIQNALLDQIHYMESIGAEQADINKLYVEWYNWNDKIAKLQKQVYEDLDDAIDNELKEIKEFYDDQKDAIDEQIDALKEARDAKEDELDLDKKLLAVEEARAKLANAQAERTVRMYNAQTGQWEWVANAKNVQSAQEALQKAEEDLAKYYEDAAYDAQIAALEAQKDALDDEFDSIKEKWQEILDALEEPAKTLEEVLSDIAKNATADMQEEIDALNAMLAQFGYTIPLKGGSMVIQNASSKYDSGGILSGLGGIKATPLAEGVLPPDLTAAMLSPQSNEVFAQRLSELRYLYGANGMPTMLSGGGSRIGSQHNGNVYTFGNITLSEAQARSTTVYELAQRSRNLALYRNVN